VPLGSQTGFGLVQPASFAPPAAVSAQATHFSAEAVPLQTPVAHASPAATVAKPHLPAEQVSVVQSFPSLQSEAETQPAHAASSPVPRQIGAAGEQPASCAVPAAVSRQRTHKPCASQLRATPQAAPTASKLCMHVPITQLSLVQSFASSQPMGQEGGPPPPPADPLLPPAAPLPLVPPLAVPAVPLPPPDSAAPPSPAVPALPSQVPPSPALPISDPVPPVVPAPPTPVSGSLPPVALVFPARPPELSSFATLYSPRPIKLPQPLTAHRPANDNAMK